MSKVDNRVVEIEFDNKNFEKNVSDTLASLDKLKKGLNLEDAAKNMSSLSDASKGFDLSHMSNAVDTIKDKFSLLGIVGVTALVNIANSAVDAGKRIVSALTFDPIMTGFGEYELKMGAVQTIMAGTGATVEEVSAKLNELNEYSDKTIYSFSDMTQNISKFTNAGVGLDDAVKAIQGVANVAAFSGANAEEASRSMYNFGQALSAGYVKLIDWKSIELANMATVKFKEELINTGLEMGTLIKVGDDYQTTTKNNKGEISDLFNTTKGFNEALNNQWMTADVLTATLQKYSDVNTDIGKQATAAATNVKTLTMLYDTLKEAAQSGWAQTFEIVVGDFEESKALWTAVNNEVSSWIGSSADIRNNLLQGWKDLGGRTELIEGLKNVFEALSNIITPIKEAFRDLFPRMTAQQLFEMTENFRKFTEHLIISKGAMDGIKSVFTVLFTIIKTGIEVIKAVIGGLASVIMALATGGDVIGAIKETYQNVVAAFTDGFDKIVVTTDGVGSKISETFTKIKTLLGDFAQTIRDKLAVVGDGLVSVKDYIAGFFASLSGGDSGNGNAFIETLGSIASAITSVVVPAFSTLKDIVKTVWDILVQWVQSVASIDVNASFGNFVSGLEWFGGVLKKIGDELARIAGPFIDLIYSLVRMLTSLFDALTRSFEGSGTNTFFDLLNGSIMVMMTINITKFMNILKTFADLAPGFAKSVIGILDGVKGVLKAYQQDIQSKAILRIAAAVGLLALSIFLLSTIDPVSLGIATGAITAMFVELEASMLALNKLMKTAAPGQMALLTLGLMGISLAVLMLASAVKKLAEVDAKELGIATGAIGVCMGMMVVVANYMAKIRSDDMIKNALSLIAFAGSIKVLASALKTLSEAVKVMGEMDIKTLGQGLASIAALLAGIYTFLSVSKLDKFGWEQAGALMMLAASIGLIAMSIKVLGDMKVGDLTKGLAVIAAVLTEIVLFNKLMGEGKGIAETGAGLLALAGALVLITMALKLIATMSVGDLVKGLVTLGIALAGLVIAVNAISKVPTGAASLLAIAGALILMAVAMKMLGEMSIGEIIKSMLAMVGMIVLLAGAALLLSPAIAPMLGLAGALALLGAAMFLAGAGLALFAVGLTALVALGTAGILAMQAMIVGLAATIPLVAIEIAKGIIAFAETIIQGAPTIIRALVVILEGLLDGLIELLPKITELIKKLVDSILEILVDAIPDMVEAGIAIILGVFEGIRDKIDDIVIVVTEIITTFITALGEAVVTVAEAAMRFLIDVINGLASAIRRNTGDLVAAVRNLYNAIKGAMKKLSDVFIEIGKDIIKGIVKGILSVGGLIKDAVTGLAGKVGGWFKDKLGIDSPSKVFAGYGSNLGEGLVVGIRAIGHRVKSAALEMGEDAKKGVSKGLTVVADAFSENIELQPTIKPVVDMTDVQNGINKTFSEAQQIDLSATKVKAAEVVSSYSASKAAEVSAQGQVQNTADNRQINIENHYSVRNDTDIRKISQDLNKTLNQHMAAKGVLAAT